jgi:3-methyladenine DNA glycosylase AlkD
MTASKVLSQLKAQAGPSYKKILMNHGANEPVFGVKIANLKKLQKQIKCDYPLALELFETGIYDAQYLAGLVTDDSKMTKKNLSRWLSKANCPAISGSIVAWVTAESQHGTKLAAQWIQSSKEDTAQTGWMTLCSLVAVKPDSELDLTELKRLLQHVKTTIHKQPNLVRYAMNGFVIAIGSHVGSLSETAVEVAETIGTVSVDMGDTACEVPSAVEYINKVKQRGAIGRKRKTAKC